MIHCSTPTVAACWVLVASAVIVACASAPGSPHAVEDRVPTGIWGGAGIKLDVVESGARVEYDCAHGTIEPLVVDSANRFDAAGTFVLEHGGPVREDEEESPEPASYSGRLEGDTLTITVTLTKTGESGRSYTATRGEMPILRKCL